jgi:hypothetical protein
MLEKFGLIAKKFLFPTIIIIAGLLVVIKGMSADAETNIMQTGGFLYGGLAILLMGIITLLYILEIINRIVHLVLMAILFCSTVGLGIMTINSVNDTIAEMDLKEKTDSFIKQGLSDIRDIQVEYKKKYGVYTSSFPALKVFLLKDSIMDILRSNGDDYPNGMPDGRVSLDHGVLLGYDPIRDDALYESYDESEALKVGIFINDTIWRGVMGVIFDNESALKKERAFMFEVSNLSNVPLSDSSKFLMFADTLDGGTPVFLVKNPYPFDPFNTKDTLMMGSMTESKNTGNWGEN